MHATPTPSPNAAIITAEAACASQRAAAPAGDTAQAQQFFLAVSVADPHPGGTQALFLADTAGSARHVADVAASAAVTGLHYYAAAQHLVCVTDDDVMTTYAERDGGSWQVHSTMRFASRAPRGGAAQHGSLRTAWAGAPLPCRAEASSLRYQAACGPAGVCARSRGLLLHTHCVG